MKKKIPLKRAEAIAQKVVKALEPYCERAVAAGSVRRKKDWVGDVEIVAQPKEVVVTSDLFGEKRIGFMDVEDGLEKIGRRVKGGHRYMQYVVDGVPVDVFVVLPPAQWGVILALRTGPADLSKWLVTQRKHGGALPSQCRVKDGAVWEGKLLMEMPEEEDFFRFCGLRYVSPEYRYLLRRER